MQHSLLHCLFTQYNASDKVHILNDAAEVRRLQDGHGGWVDAMSAVCLGDQIEQSLLITCSFRV